MPQKIILSSEEKIVCPNCQHKFALEDGITRQTIERYEQEFETALQERSDRLRQELEKEAERKLTKTFTSQIDVLKEQLSGSRESLAAMKSRFETVQQEVKANALADFELEKKLLKAQLTEKDTKLQEFREQELLLRQEKARLEEIRSGMELELRRKVDEASKNIEEQIRASEGVRFRLKEAEYQKKIEDAQKANEDLRRKLEQGSQQLQGEVLELELETNLKAAFPLDEVEAVRKGARGADVMQTVMTRTGQVCGKIVWEAKRAENWSNAWVQKLKDDQQEAGAELAVLVTTVMPRQTTEPFCMIDDIWVVNTCAARPMAETLRIILLEANKNKLMSLNKSEKMEALYHYLCSPQFAQKVRVVVEAFAGMKRDLDSEKAGMARLWKKREQQIQRVTLNMMGMCGELQAIAEESLPELDSIAPLPGQDSEAGTEAVADF